MSKNKEVLLLLTDHWADWEASHAIVGINLAENYTVRTIGVDTQPKASIGGIRAEIDHAIAGYHGFDNLSMVILCGGFMWGENNYDEIADFVQRAVSRGIPIAAICGATIFLAKHGFLNSVKHTGDERDYFEEMLADEEGYKGQEHFMAAQVVNDGGFITANETAALEFAREIFLTLQTDSADGIELWYENHKGGMVK